MRSRGQARRPLSRLQGAAEQRISSRHHCRLRAIAEAAEDRSPRLLPAALARILSTRGYDRGVRLTDRRRKSPFMGGSNFDADDLNELRLHELRFMSTRLDRLHPIHRIPLPRLLRLALNEACFCEIGR